MKLPLNPSTLNPIESVYAPKAEIDADDMEWPLPMADLTRRAQEHHQRCKDSVFAVGFRVQHFGIRPSVNHPGC